MSVKFVVVAWCRCCTAGIGGRHTFHVVPCVFVIACMSCCFQQLCCVALRALRVAPALLSCTPCARHPTCTTKLPF